MKTIATYVCFEEADLARSLLDAHGIPVHIADEYMIQANWLLSTAVGGLRLQVPEDFEEEAKELITAQSSIDPSPWGDEECVQCGSVKRERKIKGKNASLVLGMASVVFASIFLIGFPSWKKSKSCEHCGARWTAKNR